MSWWIWVYFKTEQSVENRLFPQEQTNFTSVNVQHILLGSFLRNTCAEEKSILHYPEQSSWIQVSLHLAWTGMWVWSSELHQMATVFCLVLGSLHELFQRKTEAQSLFSRQSWESLQLTSVFKKKKKNPKHFLIFNHLSVLGITGPLTKAVRATQAGKGKILHLSLWLHV